MLVLYERLSSVWFPVRPCYEFSSLSIFTHYSDVFVLYASSLGSAATQPIQACLCALLWLAAIAVTERYYSMLSRVLAIGNYVDTPPMVRPYSLLALLNTRLFEYASR